MGSGFQASWAKVGSGGFRVPGRNPEKWVPGSRPEPKKLVPGKLSQTLVTVLKKEILKVDDLDNILTKIRNIEI